MAIITWETERCGADKTEVFARFSLGSRLARTWHPAPVCKALRWALFRRKGPRKEKAEVQRGPGSSFSPGGFGASCFGPKRSRGFRFFLLKSQGAGISHSAWDLLPGCQDASLLNEIFTGTLFGSLQLYLFSWFSLRLIRNGERARDAQKRL